MIELLKHSSIPSKYWFHNELKGTAISNDVYKEIRNDFDNLYDMLEHYNNCDVKPTVEAPKS